MKRFRLACRCPTCGRQPTDRYPAASVERARSMPLEDEYRDIRCKCGQVYRIAWVALAFAEPVEEQPRDDPWAA